MTRNNRIFLFDTLFLSSLRCRRRKPLATISLLLACLLPPGAGAEIFKWVDDEGKVHYGDSAPHERESETIQTPPPPSDEEVMRSRNRLEGLREWAAEWEKAREEEKQATAREGEVRKQRCGKARRQLGVLETQAPVYQVDEQGQKAYLKDEEREAMLQRVRKLVKTNCR